ncbi:MAG: hypothetical protein AAF609_17840 [Cyanobacteria bacterium P01_C01_bin.120]
MNTAIKIFFKTGRELEHLKRHASNVRVGNVEYFVTEFRRILTRRAVAAEALEAYEKAEIRSAIAELNQLEGEQ